MKTDTYTPQAGDVIKWIGYDGIECFILAVVGCNALVAYHETNKPYAVDLYHRSCAFIRTMTPDERERFGLAPGIESIESRIRAKIEELKAMDKTESTTHLIGFLEGLVKCTS